MPELALQNVYVSRLWEGRNSFDGGRIKLLYRYDWGATFSILVLQPGKACCDLGSCLWLGSPGPQISIRFLRSQQGSRTG